MKPLEMAYKWAEEGKEKWTPTEQSGAELLTVA